MGRERKFSTEDLYHTTKQLLLDHGYEGFTFTHLANQLDVSRAAIYKYYENKEELLSEYMLFELRSFIDDLQKISKHRSFKNQFNALFDVIFNDMSIYQIREIGMQIASVNEKVKKNKQALDRLHIKLYSSLQTFIELGRSENIIKNSIPDNLFLGFIFQTVNIPNTSGLSHQDWVETMKEVICHGMFNKEN
ncbi:TetR/AcrR family transcriptional regulator [Ornithinibacillus xuwenensis]|uniref:TetR/AcrR family transcriptional regulator n=1 Tax=Ornithinibacillus xuwenensis TaxID=3144668 RepID=A0ABU9XL14_9BACI